MKNEIFEKSKLDSSKTEKEVIYYLNLKNENYLKNLCCMKEIVNNGKSKKNKLESSEFLDCIDVFWYLKFLIPDGKLFTEIMKTTKNKLIIKKVFSIIKNYNYKIERINKINPLKENITKIKISKVKSKSSFSFVSENFNSYVYVIFEENNHIMIEKMNEYHSLENKSPKVYNKSKRKSKPQRIDINEGYIDYFSKKIIDNTLYISCTTSYPLKVYVIKLQEREDEFTLISDFTTDYKDQGCWIFSNIFEFSHEVFIVVNQHSMINPLTIYSLKGEVYKLINLKNSIRFHSIFEGNIITYNKNNIDVYSFSSGLGVKHFQDEERIDYKFGLVHGNKLYVTSNLGLRVFNWSTTFREETMIDGSSQEWNILLWNSNFLLTSSFHKDIIYVHDLESEEKQTIKLEGKKAIKWIDKPRNTCLLIAYNNENNSLINIKFK